MMQIHPATAAAHGIRDGAAVELTSARGRAVARAELSTDIRPDTVFLPFHYAGTQTANRLVSSTAVDPVSAMPEFKAGSVTVRAIDAEETTR
jgi:assimilatory nitrate reductase catalytic subunit